MKTKQKEEKLKTTYKIKEVNIIKNNNTNKQ